jgi:hypothetical protein
MSKDEEITVTFTLKRRELAQFDFALADALMWIAGFNAASNGLGDGYPGDMRSLRDLRDLVRRHLDD